ncbi:MAG: heavy metal-binding domain-containing protein [Sandaracinus sp.]
MPPMFISGMSGNEIYCLRLKGIEPAEITVGNSVRSLGVAGGLSSFGRSLAGGEIGAITEMISEGRHAAIQRMEDEARKHGATGVTGVVSELRTLAGYTEFLAQGTSVNDTRGRLPFFSSAASGIELYCHLDAGYRPAKFVMGNIAYALGVGRGLMGSVRTLARGEVHEFSSMYNQIRHTALDRLKAEAARAGANAVVDVNVKMLPHGPGTVELLLTGTASHHDAISPGPVSAAQVVTSELSGEELWNLTQLGLVPHQLVMATSVYSLGVVGGIGALFQGLARGELNEVTKLVYEARENCLELIRKEAQQIGAERVIGNKLQIREIGSGMIEVVAVGTAVRRGDERFRPETPQLIPQAVIVDRGSERRDTSISGLAPAVAPMQVAQQGAQMAGNQAVGCVISAVFVTIIMFFSILMAIIEAVNGH